MKKIITILLLTVAAATTSLAQRNSIHYEMNDTEDPIIFTDAAIVLKPGGDISATKFTLKNNTKTKFNFNTTELHIDVEAYSVGKDGWIQAAEGHSSGYYLLYTDKINSLIANLEPGKTFSCEMINERILLEPNPKIKYRIRIKYPFEISGKVNYFESYFSIITITKEENTNGDIKFSTGSDFTKENIDFKSSDFIYARLQLKNSTVKEAFKLNTEPDKLAYTSIAYTMKMEKDGNTLFDYSNSLGVTMMLTEEQLSNNFLDFDVLPDPANASTVLKMTKSNIIDGGYSTRIYNEINPNSFPEDGTYKITIRLYTKTYDAWQKELSNDKWVYFEKSFNFKFSQTDIQMLKTNGQAANEKIHEAFMDIATSKKELPKVWSMPTNAITSGYSQQTIIDWALGKGRKIKLLKFYASGGSGYTTRNNEFGIPEYKYYNQGYTIFYRDLTDNKCYYIDGAIIEYKYTGGGTFEKTPSLHRIEPSLADCEKLK